MLICRYVTVVSLIGISPDGLPFLFLPLPVAGVNTHKRGTSTSNFSFLGFRLISPKAMAGRLSEHMRAPLGYRTLALNPNAGVFPTNEGFERLSSELARWLGPLHLFFYFSHTFWSVVS